MIGFFNLRHFMTNFKEYLKLAKNKISERVFLVITLVILANLIFSSSPILAAVENNVKEAQDMSFDYQFAPESVVNGIFRIINPEALLWGNNGGEDGRLPENNTLKVKHSLNLVLTAYNSEIGQCDDTPCITANGFNVCKHGKEDTVAINGVKFGTKVRFPDLFGDRVFVVRDRMNARYNSGRGDIWMVSKAEAKKFGVRVARMEVLE
jgi:3D (Asp-Asp-Asp) domain-containing protein